MLSYNIKHDEFLSFGFSRTDPVRVNSCCLYEMCFLTINDDVGSCLFDYSFYLGFILHTFSFSLFVVSCVSFSDHITVADHSALHTKHHGYSGPYLNFLEEVL